MENITQVEISPQPDLTLPLFPKRARTDCAATEDPNGNCIFDSTRLWRSQDIIGSLSSNNLQKTDCLSTAECEQYHDEKPWGLAPASHVTSVHMNGAHSESYEVSPERDVMSVVAETDEPRAAGNNTPSFPKFKQLEKSPEDETPGSSGVCLPDDENHGTQAQTHPSLIQAFTFSSDQGADTDHTFHPADVVESNLKRKEAHFSEIGPLRKAEGGSPKSSHAFLLCSNVEGGQKSDVQICDNIETKGQVNETGMTFIEFSKRSIPCYEIVSRRNISTENVSFEDQGYIGADHSAKIPAAAGISPEPAEGDNEADAFSVIDPVIWNEIDKEVERLLCNSDSTAGGGLSPLVEVCMVGKTPPPCSEVRTSQDSSSDQTKQLQDQRRTPQCGDENKVEPQACSATNNETQDQTDNEGNPQWKSSPAKAPPAGDDGSEEICDTAGPQLKEQSLSSFLAASLNHMETQELDIDRVDEAAGIKQQHLPEETESDKLRNLETTKSVRADICVMDVTAEGEEQTQEVDFGGVINSGEWETSEKQGESEEHEQKQSELIEDISEESSSQDVGEWVENRLTLFNGEDPEQRLGCFPHDQHTPDISTLCTVPPTTDAVVPCRSQNAHQRSISLKLSCSTPCNSVLREFDTFEKIKLSPDDDDGDSDDAAGLSSMPVLISLSRQLLNTPQEQREHHVQVADREINEKTHVEGDEKEKERSGCHPDNMENGFVSSDSNCNEVPNLISAADVSTPAQPEKEPSCGSAWDSSQCSHNQLNPQSSAVLAESRRPSPDLNHSFDFEMKEQFSRVLQELNLFFDVSRNELSDCGRSSPKPCNDLPESTEDNTSKPMEHLGIPAPGHYAYTSTEKAVEDHSLVMCGVDPVGSCPVIRGDGEQEVPLNGNLGQEPSMDTEEKNRESQEAEQKVEIWSPSFMCLPHLEPLSHRPPELPRRLEPLKTCTRPIRVGLSKRAKTKQLHHLHPYK
ncbi:uncharacterized protein LOC124881894 isoform X1 [Girardinichthys multiradiatus]|uniref:uncharacterized protein LOC124881894 isoform X1 n=1 Tax=Girardinichthys multiradiatus TaxID=208333 RepID=UPI001FAE1D9E|nr:uncharacterized protein LOC124881894 isoform X1 [Girardinichthys multiradiatus]